MLLHPTEKENNFMFNYFVMTAEDAPTKSKAGIKSFLFTSTGLNGESHRKNRIRKKLQYLKNQAVRRDINARRSSMSSGEWHTSLKALSGGNV